MVSQNYFTYTKLLKLGFVVELIKITKRSRVEKSFMLFILNLKKKSRYSLVKKSRKEGNFLLKIFVLVYF